jgi:hypothetical protein
MASCLGIVRLDPFSLIVTFSFSAFEKHSENDLAPLVAMPQWMTIEASLAEELARFYNPDYRFLALLGEKDSIEKCIVIYAK